MNPVEQLFPEHSPETREKLQDFAALFREWNQKINLVSRKDIDSFELHHLCHSLALSKWISFQRENRVLDVGTGGGLPGLPLAILFPHTRFFLCDSIEKKVKAVQEMKERLELKNVEVVHKRAETLESKWDFVLGRAVTNLPRFLGWVHGNIRRGETDGFKHGVLYWKGSLYQDELASLGLEPTRVMDIQEELNDPYFQEKYIIHLEASKIPKPIEE